MENTRFSRVRRGMGYALMASLLTTLVLLVLEGRWRDALPLHLCSIAALAAVALALYPRRAVLEYLWYLGMPGAALALLFPAPAVSRFQTLMNVSYIATHELILIIPLALIARGMRPRLQKGVAAFIFLQGIAVIACGVNALLDTDFLFLSAPPAGTPLEAVYEMGYPVYLVVLETLMLLSCMAMDRLAGLMQSS